MTDKPPPTATCERCNGEFRFEDLATHVCMVGGLRDQFAMAAPEYPFEVSLVPGVDTDPTGKVATAYAQWAYAFADAMLEARK